MAPSHEHRAKKRRLDSDAGQVDTFKPATRFKPTEPRTWTVSVAVPTSIITDCVTREQRTTIAGRIARALAVFSVDEVVIFDDRPRAGRVPGEDKPESYTGETDPAHFLHHILTYLETPPFMRKTLFPLHPNLRSQGLLPSLDMPHHPHKDEWLPYREGLTLEGSVPKNAKGTMVDIGMPEPVRIAEAIPPRTRVTLQMPDPDPDPDPSTTTKLPEPVHPSAPRTEAGYFWGFGVRTCASLSDVFTTSDFADGYDVSIGTSERGVALAQAFPRAGRPVAFRHLLVVFGGPRGLEYAAMNDAELARLDVAGARTRDLFDHWVNVLPNQGSRTIRTDEAVLVALTGLRRLWDAS